MFHLNRQGIISTPIRPRQDLYWMRRWDACAPCQPPAAGLRVARDPRGLRGPDVLERLLAHIRGDLILLDLQAICPSHPTAVGLGLDLRHARDAAQAGGGGTAHG